MTTPPEPKADEPRETARYLNMLRNYGGTTHVIECRDAFDAADHFEAMSAELALRDKRLAASEEVCRRVTALATALDAELARLRAESMRGAVEALRAQRDNPRPDEPGPIVCNAIANWLEQHAASQVKPRITPAMPEKRDRK